MLDGSNLKKVLYIFVYSSHYFQFSKRMFDSQTRNGLPTPTESRLRSRPEIITKRLRINFDINQSFLVSTVGAKAYCVLLPIKPSLVGPSSTKTTLMTLYHYGYAFCSSVGGYTKSQKQTRHYATTIQSSFSCGVMATVVWTNCAYRF